MSKEEKIKVSNSIPDWFKQVVCDIMLSDGSIRMNGKLALLGIQQTHQELTQEINSFFFLPFFTSLYNDWYKSNRK
jgi:hypothetical protein